MKRLIIWLAILLPLFANAQIWDGGTLQRNRTDSTIRGNFGSRGLKTIPTVLGTSVQGQLLQYSAANNAWVPYTIPIDGSTGIISGGTITGLGGANAIVASGTGTILDNTSPSSPALYELSWVTDTIGLTDNATNYLYYDSLGVLNATTVIPNPANFRTRVYLGRAQKTSGSITSINGAYVPIQQTPANLKDMFTAYGLTKTGLVVSPASTNLTIAVASGGIFSFGANFQSSVLNPNNLSYTANSPQTFRMVTAGDISVTNITVLPVGSYNPTGTTVSAIGGGANESSIFTVYKFPTTGNVRILYGQTLYSSLANAVQAIGSYVPNPPAVFSDAIIIGYIAAVKTATDLSNTAQAVFVTTNKFGGVGGGFASTALTNYVQKTGDTMTGTLNGTDINLSGDILADSVKVIGGTSNQFMKADGSLSNLAAVALPAPGMVTKAEGGAGVLSAGVYNIGVTAVSAEGGESSFDYEGYYYNSDPLTIGASKSIDVSWLAVPGAVAYRVYIGDASQSYYLRYFETTNLSLNINTVPPAALTVPVVTPSNTGGNLKAGNYYVAYTAVFADGETIGPTASYLFPVANITSDVGSIGVTWTAVTGATGYKVYVVSETDGSYRMATKYFTTATNSATITGNETYVTGLGAFSSKGNIEFESTAPAIASSFVQTGNNKNFFSADIAINGFKGANADLLLKRYDNALTPFGQYSFAGLSLGTGTATNWQSGVGTANEDWNTYNYGTAGLSTKISFTDNSYSVYGALNALSGVKATGLGTFTGLGAEMLYTAGTGFFQTYNRTGAVYLPTVLSGSTLDLRIGTSSALSIDASRNSTFSGGQTTFSKANGTTFGGSSQAKILSGASGNRAELHLTDGITSDAFVSFLPSATASTRNVEISANGADGGIKIYGDGQVKIDTAPTTSAGSYDVLTRNSSTGFVEKVSFASSTSTPTLTGVSNVASSAANAGRYTRIGQNVTMYGHISVTPSVTATNTSIRLSLPIGATLGSTTILSGSGSARSGGDTPVFVIADTVNNEALLYFTSTDTSAHGIEYSYSYTMP